MISIYEYALLASDVYQESYQPFPLALKARGWSRVEELILHEGGFLSRFYHRKKYPRDCVIAYRGTKITRPDNWFNDAEILFNIKPFYKNRAESFYLTVNRYLRDNNIHFNPKLTGHSLGGLLAKLTAIHYQLYAVAFNAPGIGSNLGVNANIPHPKILNIDAKEGSFNKLGKKIGQEIKIDVAENIRQCDKYSIRDFFKPNPEGALSRWAICKYHKHQLEYMLESIKKNVKLKNMKF